MKFKHLLLCAAAGILMGGSAQANDILVKKIGGAKAVEYVETCPVFGRSFIKMPGTDICMGLRGGLEVKFSFVNPRTSIKEDGKSFDPPKAVTNTTGWMIKIKPGFDFRSQTEYGTLRTFFAFKTEIDNGIHNDRLPVLTGSPDFKIDKAYIEWAGFLVGLQNSPFQYFAHDDVILSISADPKITNFQFTYTWKLGSGTKATLGVEDTGDDIKMRFNDLNKLVETTTGGGKPDVGPQRWNYAIVSSLSTEQSWGDGKLAVMLDPLATQNGVHREVKWGWAALAGITLNLPQLGPKDQVMFQAVYCDGVVKNACLQKNLSIFDDNGFVIEGLQRKDVAAFLTPDGTGGWKTNTTKITSLAAQYRHYWAPLCRSNITGSYAIVNTPDVAHTALLKNGGLGNARGWDAALNLIWGESRKTAEIGTEVMWKSLQQDLPLAGSVIVSPYEKDPKGWAATTWIKRSW